MWFLISSSSFHRPCTIKACLVSFQRGVRCVCEAEPHLGAAQPVQLTLRHGAEGGAARGEDGHRTGQVQNRGQRHFLNREQQEVLYLIL